MPATLDASTARCRRTYVVRFHFEFDLIARKNREQASVFFGLRNTTGAERYQGGGCVSCMQWVRNEGGETGAEKNRERKKSAPSRKCTQRKEKRGEFRRERRRTRGRELERDVLLQRWTLNGESIDLLKTRGCATAYGESVGRWKGGREWRDDTGIVGTCWDRWKLLSITFRFLPLFFEIILSV